VASPPPCRLALTRGPRMHAPRQRRNLQAAASYLLLLLCAQSPLPAGAVELPKEKGVARTVKMFDMFCLSQLPDVDGIERFAGFGEFAQMVGEELAPYSSGLPGEKVLGWRFHDFGAELILTATRAKPDASFTQGHPKFAKAKSVSCSLLIPNDAPRDEVVKALGQRLGQPPDESNEDGNARLSAWNKETAKAVSRVVYRAPASKGGKATLSAHLTYND
jgi:hypothetical protein